MPDIATSPGAFLRDMWDRFSRMPGGKRLFSGIFGAMVPYAGTIRPQILELGPGFARVQMADRRGVRNHLSSIHAVAMMNLGEMTSGLALAYSLPDDARSIITGLSMEYLKKARGKLMAECRFVVPEFGDRQEHEIDVSISDQSGEIVARAKARWTVGRKNA